VTEQAPVTGAGERASKPAFLPSEVDPTVFDEGFLRQLERLLLIMKRPVRGGLKGGRRSVKRGQSVEFADYRDYVRYGGSPRGAQALVTAGKIYALLDGRFNVSIDDIRAVALPALRHRVILNFEGEAEGITPEAIVRSILDAVAPPSVE